jgi:hypothetical protein
VLWLQATQTHDSLEQLTTSMGRLSTTDSDRDQLYSSLREFLSLDQLKAIVWDSIGTAYSVLHLIMTKLYPHLKWHHNYASLWFSVTGQAVIDAPEILPDPKTIARKVIETNHTGSSNVSELDAIKTFTKHPYSLKLFECFTCDSELFAIERNNILDVFWFSKKWYNSIMNVSEACKFRDQVWESLIRIPDIIESLSEAQKYRMCQRLGIQNTMDIYCANFTSPSMLFKVVKYLDSLSLFE